MHHLWFIEYHVVHCLNISPLKFIFVLLENSSQWYFDLRMPVSITPWSYYLYQALWCGMCFTLTTLCVVHWISSLQCVTHTFWITGIHVLPHMVSSSVLFLFFFLNFVSLNIYIYIYNLGRPKLHELHSYMPPQTKKIIITGHFIHNVYTVRYLSLPIFWLQLWWVTPHEMLNGCIIPSLGVILHVLRQRSTSISLIQYSILFLNLSRKDNIKGYLIPVYPSPKSNLTSLFLLFQ